ncbi:hypothetical protein DID88_006522 [Monilinia fructigena]|uniref:Cupin type-1 domain-containing protein n=1 Tax=Monilinia fructigena TaxID=38457 RepID=A0A395IJ87_9HELO|nr:hypothetical protein DID88_006522 [Monilinia fructigena]
MTFRNGYAILLITVFLKRNIIAAPTGDPLLGFHPSNVVVNQNTDAIDYELAPGQKDPATVGAYLDFSTVKNPQPIRGTKGGTDAGPRTEAYDILNPDKLAPPGTDHGNQNVDNIPAATEMAGVNMRLEEGGYRELHWHKAAEWAYIFNGSVRLQAVNEDGQTFVDDLSAGDVWFFPPGIPHSLQGLKGGTEFLLVFDDGSFSEDNTFLASEVFAHNPLEVLSKNFQLPESACKNITGSAGIIPQEFSYSYHLSKAPLTHDTPGGTIKILDPKTFPIAEKFSAAVVTVHPGAMREIHWHTTSDEWNFFIAENARISIYAAQGTTRTFDYHAGDCGYIPKGMTHYVENVGKDDVVFIEVLQADHFSDISVGQWVGLTPKQIVADTLNLSDETVSAFKKEKQFIVQNDAVA